nr:alcohol dehydrogenase catalytic domain-containing protein [Pedobacter panaciterrae]
MQQAVLTTPGEIEFRDIPMPGELKENEILLRIQKIGVCGSDIHVFHGKHPFVTKYPVIQGHEYSGEVVKIGSNVTAVQPGMKATARPQVVCGHCPPCLRGQYNVCQNLTVQGFVANGSAQEYFVVTQDRIVTVPDNVSYEQAALIEPAAVGAHSTLRAGDLHGKNVVVAGAGTIGNLIAQFAIARGAKKVLLTTAKSDFRLGVARQCGITETANLSKEDFPDAARRVFGDEGFQVGFEAAGAQGAVTDLIAGVENGGTVIIVGVFEENPIVNMGFLGEHELNVLGSMMYRHQDYEEAVTFIAEGKLITEPLITSRFPFSQYLDAYHFIEQQGDKSLKVMIDVAQK